MSDPVASYEPRYSCSSQKRLSWQIFIYYILSVRPHADNATVRLSDANSIHVSNRSDCGAYYRIRIDNRESCRGVIMNDMHDSLRVSGSLVSHVLLSMIVVISI